MGLKRGLTIVRLRRNKTQEALCLRIEYQFYQRREISGRKTSAVRCHR